MDEAIADVVRARARAWHMARVETDRNRLPARAPRVAGLDDSARVISGERI